MKAFILLISVYMGFISTVANAAEPAPQNGGRYYFTGSVTDGPCAVKGVDDSGRLVLLSEVELQQLTSPGEAAGQVRIFHVVLDDCDISVYTNARISFHGETDKTFKSVLVNSSVDDPAENIGLQLYGPDGEKIIPDDSSSIVLQKGMNIVPLSVDYVPVGLHPKAGSVVSVVTFNIVYS